MSSETEGEEENGQNLSLKRIPKKKHYPFGTPSHAHPAFSEFVHLKVTDKEFGTIFTDNNMFELINIFYSISQTVIGFHH